jgi:peptide deformylase
MKIITPKKPSKKVTNIQEIQRDIFAMQAALETNDFGMFKGDKEHHALHHSQVNEDPFNFFVIKRSLVRAKDNEMIAVINPEIIEVQESSRILHLEGCMSFPFRPDKKVHRYNEIKVRYETPSDDAGELQTKEETVYGIIAFIFQHEIQHGKGGNIYK